VLSTAGGQDIFIARYSPDGALVWVKQAGGAGNDQTYDITALPDDSVVIAGFHGADATFGLGEANETLLPSAGGMDMALARFQADGSLAWAKRAGGPANNECGSGVAQRFDGRLVVIGSFGGTATFGADEPVETVLTGSGGMYTFFIALYAP
jgi:hypothetical protein